MFNKRILPSTQAKTSHSLLNACDGIMCNCGAALSAAHSFYLLFYRRHVRWWFCAKTPNDYYYYECGCTLIECTLQMNQLNVMDIDIREIVEFVFLIVTNHNCWLPLPLPLLMINLIWKCQTLRICLFLCTCIFTYKVFF